MEAAPELETAMSIEGLITAASSVANAADGLKMYALETYHGLLRSQMLITLVLLRWRGACMIAWCGTNPANPESKKCVQLQGHALARAGFP